jgi:uncharacterized protein (TIGR02246 family)
MRALLFAIAAAVAAPLCAQPVAAAAVQAEASAKDRAEILALYARWEEAWNSHNGAAWADLFHEDGTWVLWTGGSWTGRTHMEAEMRKVFETVYAKSVQRWRSPPEIRFLAPDVAVARAISTTTGDSRQSGVTIHGNKMLVLTRRAGVWKVLFGQNSRLTEAEVAKLRN